MNKIDLKKNCFNIWKVLLQRKVLKSLQVFYCIAARAMWLTTSLQVCFGCSHPGASTLWTLKQAVMIAAIIAKTFHEL